MQVVNQLTSEFRLFFRQLVRIAQRDSPSSTNGFRELRSKLNAPQLARHPLRLRVLARA
jgi:hypothetical protein